MSIDPNSLPPQEGTHDDLNTLFGDYTGESQIPHSGVSHDEYPVDTFKTPLDEAVSRKLIDSEAPDGVHVDGDEITPIRDLSSAPVVETPTTPTKSRRRGLGIGAGFVAGALLAGGAFAATRGGEDQSANIVPAEIAADSDDSLAAQPTVVSEDGQIYSIEPTTVPQRGQVEPTPADIEDGVGASSEDEAVPVTTMPEAVDNPMDFRETAYIEGSYSEITPEDLIAQYTDNYIVMMNGIKQSVLQETASTDPTETQLQAIDHIAGPWDSVTKTILRDNVRNANKFRQDQNNGFRVEIVGWNVVPEQTKMASSRSIITVSQSVVKYNTVIGTENEERTLRLTFDYITVDRTDGIQNAWLLSSSEDLTAPGI